MWVDEDAVLLAHVAPTDELPPFFLRGYDETLTVAAQAENRRRIAAAIKMTNEWRQSGVVGRISELNVEDLSDVRAQLAGPDAAVEVRLGASNYEKRLVTALEVLDARRNAGIIRLDTTMLPRGNVIVGVKKDSLPNAMHTTSADTDNDRLPASNNSPLAASSVASASLVARAPGTKRLERTRNARSANNKSRREVQAARSRGERAAREDERKEAKRESAKPKTTALAQRPRRVG
jgi:hypothetical protein